MAKQPLTGLHPRPESTKWQGLPSPLIQVPLSKSPFSKGDLEGL